MAKQVNSAPQQREPREADDDPVLSLPEISRQLKIPPALIYGLVQFGIFKPIKLASGLKGVHRSTVNRLMAASQSERRVQ